MWTDIAFRVLESFSKDGRLYPFATGMGGGIPMFTGPRIGNKDAMAAMT